MVLFAIFILGGLLYLVYLPFKIWLLRTEKISYSQSRKINRIYFGVLTATVLIITYIGVFPDENFYADEFKKVTLRELPDSADFVSKTATYPDFHGDYWSRSEIELSKADYNKLLLQLNNDSRITKTTTRERIYNAQKDDNNIVYHFTRQEHDGGGPYLYIGFDKNCKTIYIDVVRF